MTARSSTEHRLTDTQLVLLSQAAQHPAGKVVPPANLRGGAVQRVVAALALKGLIAVCGEDDECAASSEPDSRKPDFVITSEGLAAIGLAPEGDAGDTLPADVDGKHAAAPAQAINLRVPPETVENRSIDAPEDAPVSAPRSGSKQAQVLAMLSGPGGATIDELMAMTGWQPHTTRAVLSGLRKRGHTIERSSGIDGASRYQILAGGAEAAPNVMPVDTDVLAGAAASSPATPAS